jgi:hypothetical protein
MEVSDRKRPRDEQDPSPAAPEQQQQKLMAPPPYGSQAYWEERYKNMKEVKKADDEDKPNAFHAWYFNYEELAPILLPLILGDGVGEGGDDDDDDDDDEEENGEEEDGEENDNGDDDENDEGEDVEIAEESDEEQESGQNDDNETKEDNTGEQDDEGEEVEIAEESDEEEEEEEDAPERVGLAKNGPISILEVGCGDVPLGRDIAKNVKDLESTAGVEATNILKKVVCVDYSKSVIEAMKKELSEKESDDTETKPSVPLVYEVVDARKLPYADESYELIIEKGTLDAMLSDTKVGAGNCGLIVSECARVLTIGGEVLI